MTAYVCIYNYNVTEIQYNFNFICYIYIIIVTVYIYIYVCSNPVLTLHCIELHSGPLVVLYPYSNVMLLVTCMYTHLLFSHHIVRMRSVVLCPLSYLLRVTSSVRNLLGVTLF